MTTPSPAIVRHVGWARWVLCALTLGCLLIPGNRLGAAVYPICFGVPLLVAAVRSRRDRDFLLWRTYILAFVTFILIRRAADDLGFPLRAEYAASFDLALGAGRTPTHWLQRWLYQPGSQSWVTLTSLAVYLAYYVAGPLAGAVLWVRRSPEFSRYVVAMAATYLVGAIVHIVVPTVPPWMAGQTGVISPVYRVLYDVMYGAVPGFYQYGYSIAGGNDVAAMPSLHMVTAALVAMGLNGFNRSRWVGWGYAVGMSFALVYLGEHYVADELGGVALALATWSTVPRFWEGKGATRGYA